MKKILYLHGKEGSVQGTKVRYIQSLNKYKTVCFPYDTGVGDQPWQDFIPGCIEKAKKWVQGIEEVDGQEIQGERPDLIVASSFGGGVLLSLIQSGDWQGDSIILAGAGIKYGLPATLPTGQKTVLIHGVEDEIISMLDSVVLGSSSEDAKVVLLKDGHRLYRILGETGILAAEIDQLLS